MIRDRYFRLVFMAGPDILPHTQATLDWFAYSGGKQAIQILKCWLMLERCQNPYFLIIIREFVKLLW